APISMRSRVNRYNLGVMLLRSIHSWSVWKSPPTKPRPSRAGVPSDMASADSDAPPLPADFRIDGARATRECIDLRILGQGWEGGVVRKGYGRIGNLRVVRTSLDFRK